MELYLLIVIVLFTLAISDLVVGVSNDAVNFLNSAVGSKAASFKVIMAIASIGIITGVIFSSGMMEVARKGIFNPEMFLFQEVMIIFLAVMLSDVLLLDLFNTFGLPTSTTVSLIFELIGAAVAVSLLKIIQLGHPISELLTYINTAKALAIITGILISVVVAFGTGAIIQFFTRMIFTFDFQKRLRRYGGIWGGMAIAFITYFILVKGAKGAIFFSEDQVKWIQDNTGLILLASFLFWGIIIQLLVLFTKINVLKPIVLFGTFALALAFAANDLVNFIGVPLAGFSSYLIANVSEEPFNLLMNALRAPVETPTLFLLAAGVVMTITLWISKKARTVTKTEVNLGRQADGFERFESSALSRSIVRMALVVSDFFKRILPASFLSFLQKRFDLDAFKGEKKKGKDPQAFDLLRASVNLLVASMLISFATSLKLPLSTTYVTFMVAMGTSLSDKSWGRESAVYRINGVMTVVGGWFFTAFMAFTLAGIFATVIFFGGIYAIIGLVALAAFIIFHTHGIHKRNAKESKALEMSFIEDTSSSKEMVQKNIKEVETLLSSVYDNLSRCYEAFYEGNRSELKKNLKESKKINKQSNLIISNIFKEVRILRDDESKLERRYGKEVASIREITGSLRNLNQLVFDHIDNNHSTPSKEQVGELKKVNKLINSQIKNTLDFFESGKDKKVADIENIRNELTESLLKFDKNQVQRIKKQNDSARNSLLYLDVLSNTENISISIYNLFSALRKNLEEIK